jgi:uncharacterized protein (TIGR03000 family)
VRLPADALLDIDGVRTRKKGPVRQFQSPPLPVGTRYPYHLKATWKEKDKEIVRERDVEVEAGKETQVDLRKEEPPRKKHEKRPGSRRIVALPRPLKGPFGHKPIKVNMLRQQLALSSRPVQCPWAKVTLLRVNVRIRTRRNLLVFKSLLLASPLALCRRVLPWFEPGHGDARFQLGRHVR